MKPDDPRHGTRAGWDQHYRDGEEACDPCTAANRDYQAQWRARTTNWRAQARARSRALNALARRFPVEFHELYTDALTKIPAGDGDG